MFVIEVIPLQRGISVESLTYYSACTYTIGTLLSVPLRNQEVTAVVITSKPVSVAKTALKTATFSLRKLQVQEHTITLPQSLIATAKKIEEQIPASIGSILFSMLPPDLRDGTRTYPRTTFHVGEADSTPQILTDTTQNRFISYRSTVRETFAHRGSVIFVVPSTVHVEQAKKRLETGIENRIITFSSALTAKQLRESYEAFEDLSGAKLIITTPSFAFLDRHDITTIIIEKSGSAHYKLRNRPYLDVREVLKTYAEVTKRSILLGDILPSTEDEVLRRDDVYTTHNEHSKRLELPGTITLAQHPQKESGEKFSLTTQLLNETLKRVFASNAHVFLFGARKGLAPLVTCYDCGHIFRCKDSGAPYSLMRTFAGDVEERWFVSSTSGKKIRAADTCPTCGGWRLREQGIGIQQIYDHVRTLFPKIDIFLFDHTTATTHKKALKIIENFYASKKAILIGTQMTVPYLSKPVDTTAVISYEATRAVPTWKADETVFGLLLQLRECTIKDVIVQLRTEPDDILKLCEKGLVDQFYDDEIAIRKALLYPPFSTFILLSWTGTKLQTQDIEEALKAILTEIEIQFYSAPHSNSEQTLRYGLIRNNKGLKFQKELTARLRLLPPYIKIEINPDKIV